MTRDRARPLAEPRCGEEDIERIRGHLHELIARWRTQHHETGRAARRGSERRLDEEATAAAPGSRTLLDVLAEEPESALPGVGRGRLVVDVRPVVVEESVVDTGVDVDLGLLAGLLDRRVGVLGHLRSDEAVRLRSE